MLNDAEIERYLNGVTERVHYGCASAGTGVLLTTALKDLQQTRQDLRELATLINRDPRVLGVADVESERIVHHYGWEERDDHESANEHVGH